MPIPRSSPSTAASRLPGARAERGGPIALLALLATLYVSACTPGATRPAGQPRPDHLAVELESRGDFRAAAAEYLRLAELYPDRETSYALGAAGSLLDAGDVEGARAILDPVTGKLDAADALHRSILRARFALLDGKPAEALALIPGDTAAAPIALQARAGATRAEAFEMSGDLMAAAKERVFLSGIPRGEAAERENLLRLWSDLNGVGEERLAAESSTDGEFSSWVQLAVLNLRSGTTPDRLRADLATWMEANPAHSAVPLITDAILAQSRRFESAPRQIALLLPLTGQYGNAGAAIRDGVLAAWYRDPAFRPEIRVYDANSLNVVERYTEAVSDGAQFVIGPLEKVAITKLIDAGTISVPTLALNRLDGGAGDERMHELGAVLPNLIQYGLTPEDEARQAAQRAIFDGHARALIVAPLNDWGRRLAMAFESEWRALGGMVVEQVDYEPALNDFSETVGELLNVDSSEARARMLRERLGRRLEYGARLREDADMVFMAAVPVAARQILPQFRFFGAERLPVYSSSHAFTGNLNPALDSDMNGLMFPDMPWVLEPGDETEESVNRNWSSRSSGFRRLYALGADALRLIPELGRLSTQPGAIFTGATGSLLLDRNAIIQRRLTWARIVEGAPRLLDRNAGG
jgi:outer membrane PBP1 activator LpoA protein